MSNFLYQRIGDEPYSDSEAMGIPLVPQSIQSASGKKKSVNIFPSHRRYHDTLDSMGIVGSKGSISTSYEQKNEDMDVIYNTNDEFGEGNLGIINNLKLVRTGRQRKKQASRSKGSEFQTRRKKRRVYFCCISSEIDIQKLYDFMNGPEPEGKFKEWRLKLHNDVVHLYKAGNSEPGETPKYNSNGNTNGYGNENESMNPLHEEDKKVQLTDDETMNESANEGGNRDTFRLSSVPIYRGGTVTNKRTTFASDREDKNLIQKQDSLDEALVYENIDGQVDEKQEEELRRIRASKIAESSFYDNSLWKLSLPKVQEVFVFDFGAAVFWGFARGEEKKFLNTFKMFTTRGFVGESEFDRSEDDMGFVISPDVDSISIANEVFALPEEVSPKQRLSISFAIAQSSVLAIFEARIEKLIEEYKYIPESMATDGKARLTERQLGTMIGEVFVIRHDVNLHSEILDTPDFFWKQEDIEKDYKMVMNYLEMGARTEVLNKRLDMLRELLDVLQQQMENAHAVKLEWIVIWLIVIEVILQLIAVANEAGWWI